MFGRGIKTGKIVPKNSSANLGQRKKTPADGCVARELKHLQN
jgi:hypothetical protein